MHSPERNELAAESSPYLLQHAHQPVHWRAWGPRSLAAARSANRPIMLSIGYAACHWCHVMAHESFDNAATAQLLNGHFVSIKVDREERPDIDQIYMTALHAMGQQGGWPLTMFLTPQGEPFWGGTYFPPEPRWGRPSFSAVLQAVAGAYERRDPALLRNAGLLAQAIQAGSRVSEGCFPERDRITRAASDVLNLTDEERGGLRGAPKFPNFPVYRFLAQRGARGDSAAAAAVHRLLASLCLGGIHDHVGGGLFRYATDAVWLVPHFEKMLYDNGQFVELLALAHADAPSPRYRAAASRAVDFMLRDLDASGAFAASLDADTEAGEGAYYTWTENEVDAALGVASGSFKHAFDVTAEGNWEGRTILRRVPGQTRDDDEITGFNDDLAVLAHVRSARPHPALDDKVLTDWNGLAISALCRAAHVFEVPEWLEAARRRFETVRGRLFQNGRWQHAWRAGRVSAAGLLDDLAAVADAALALYQATGQQSYKNIARAAIAEADIWHGPAEEGYAMTASDTLDIPRSLGARPRSATCSAVPSGSGMMARALARLFHLTGDAAYRDRARAVIKAFAGRYDQPIGSVTLLAAAELLEDGVTVVVAGDPDLPITRTLLGTALSAPDPACCVLRLFPADELPAGHPAHGKTAPPGTALAYVCRGGACLPPTDDPAVLRRALRTPPG